MRAVARRLRLPGGCSSEHPAGPRASAEAAPRPCGPRCAWSLQSSLVAVLRGPGEPRRCVPAAPPFRAWTVGPRGLAPLHVPLGAAERGKSLSGCGVRRIPIGGGCPFEAGLGEGCARRGTAAHATFSCAGRLLNFPLGWGVPLTGSRG